MNSPILPILPLTLVVMATSLEPSERGGQIGNLRSNSPTYHMIKNLVKIGPVDAEVILLKSLFYIEEINASRIIARGAWACMPRRLK